MKQYYKTGNMKIFLCSPLTELFSYCLNYIYHLLSVAPSSRQVSIEVAIT